MYIEIQVLTHMLFIYKCITHVLLDRAGKGMAFTAI